MRYQINMTMKKVPGQYTAAMLANYEKSVKHFVSIDQNFLFTNQIKQILAYWKSFSNGQMTLLFKVDCTKKKFFIKVFFQ